MEGLVLQEAVVNRSCGDGRMRFGDDELMQVGHDIAGGVQAFDGSLLFVVYNKAAHLGAARSQRSRQGRADIATECRVNNVEKAFRRAQGLDRDASFPCPKYRTLVGVDQCDVRRIVAQKLNCCAAFISRSIDRDDFVCCFETVANGAIANRVADHFRIGANFEGRRIVFETRG